VIFVPLFGFVLCLRTPLTSGKTMHYLLLISLFGKAYYREIMTKHFQSIPFNTGGGQEM